MSFNFLMWLVAVHHTAGSRELGPPVGVGFSHLVIWLAWNSVLVGSAGQAGEPLLLLNLGLVASVTVVTCWWCWGPALPGLRLLAAIVGCRPFLLIVPSVGLGLLPAWVVQFLLSTHPAGLPVLFAEEFGVGCCLVACFELLGYLFPR